MCFKPVRLDRILSVSEIVKAILLYALKSLIVADYLHMYILCIYSSF